MDISVELSCYPLADEYIPPIKAFIDKINQTEGVTAITNSMSTQLFGDQSIVFPLLQQAMTSSWQEQGKAIFVCKFINGNLKPD